MANDLLSSFARIHPRCFNGSHPDDLAKVCALESLFCFELFLLSFCIGILGGFDPLSGMGLLCAKEQRDILWHSVCDPLCGRWRHTKLRSKELIQGRLEALFPHVTPSCFNCVSVRLHSFLVQSFSWVRRCLCTILPLPFLLGFTLKLTVPQLFPLQVTCTFP